MGDNEHMQSTLSHLPMPVEVEPHESQIVLPLNPDRLSDETLRVLQITAEPRDTPGDVLRDWLRGVVLSEVGRRVANDDEAANVPLEAAGWGLPWHTFDDAQLAAALATSFSWCGMFDASEAAAVFGHIHRAVVVACATRLKELHTAIENSRRKKGQ